MNITRLFIIAIVLACLPACSLSTTSDDLPDERTLLTQTRQLTFAGKRSGEGYFSADGHKLIFQSERDDDNPFYQIYLTDLESGDTERVSPGDGKTTCAWIHPAGDRVLFASTLEDPEARKKQAEELAFRASGKQRRYSWDYDEHYDIFTKDLKTGTLRNLTHVRGYDAEGSYSPDGKLIAFASNRAAYKKPLSAEDAQIMARDPSYFMDLYVMNADGSNVHQITRAPGYDGGPFFSADGSRLCWRRFGKDGATAEIFTANVDGSDEKQLTRMGVLSWAPYFHPSGRYLIFATNKHGFANFELYLVDAEGRHEPMRVTDSDGFDGLAAFSPDGTRLTWTSNRNNKQSQIFLADWDHNAALHRLGLTAGIHDAALMAPVAPGVTETAIRAADLRRHVEALASDAMAGRLTGTPGEHMATDYVAQLFKRYGLVPAGDNGTYFQHFEFTAGVELGKTNTLSAARDGNTETLAIEKSWRPLAYSKTGNIDATPVVFAGYGLEVPADQPDDEYDSYVHLDVKDKWVMILRYLPAGLDEAKSRAWARYASLRHKTMIARDHGARGVIFVSGPNAKVTNQIVPLHFDATLAGTSLAAVSINDATATQWLAAAGKNFKALHDHLDTGKPAMGFELPDLKVSAQIDIQKQSRTGRNVLGVLRAGEKPAASTLIIGAHVDHLGKGPHGSSRGEDVKPDAIHYGADDNASGVAAVLEMAEWLADEKLNGQLKPQHDILFAAWSGEELGLLGSSHFIDAVFKDAPANAHQAQGPRQLLACLNLDMVGRYDQKLTLQGIGSSSVWTGLIERANAPVGLNLALVKDSYLPTDSTPFYARGVPILTAFTGAHADYHAPTDTADKLNYPAAEKITKLMGRVAESLSTRTEQPNYLAQKAPERSRTGALRAYLGTIPDYANEGGTGLKLSGVAKDGPADKAGVRGGDVVIGMAGKTIENIYDYTRAIEAVKAGEPTEIIVRRGNQVIKLQITPGSRD